MQDLHTLMKLPLLSTWYYIRVNPYHNLGWQRVSPVVIYIDVQLGYNLVTCWVGFFNINNIVVVVVEQSTIANVIMMEEIKEHVQSEGKPSPLKPRGTCHIWVHLFSCTQNKNFNSL
jgi:hypothetical protein